MTAAVELEDTGTFGGDEGVQAKAYWSGRRFDYYNRPRPWSDFMAAEILALDPAAVFELGCGPGKNLVALRQKRPGLFASGIDVNAAAIAFGRAENGLRLACGDETVLDIFPDRAFDVAFTVSVLDHLPEPGAALEGLARVSRKAVLLLELFTGTEGKVVRNIDRRTGEWIDTTPYSYSWDYARLCRERLPLWRCEVQDAPIDSNLGRYYKLYRLSQPVEER